MRQSQILAQVPLAMIDVDVSSLSIHTYKVIHGIRHIIGVSLLGW